MSELKYKIGDKVITTLGHIGTIIDIKDNKYEIFFKTDSALIHQKRLKLYNMNELNIIEEANTYWDSIKDAWVCPEGYVFKDENGNVINATKIVLEKKKKEYPKTYEECLKILGISDGEFMFSGLSDNEYDLFDRFVILKRCRDAYWKIAGEEMGLGKPWKPDWEDVKSRKYVIVRGERGKIITGDTTSYARAFAFPTPEMRDAFKEYFDSDLEICKELL